jgi:DNA-binding transcriptional MerR regulator
MTSATPMKSYVSITEIARFTAATLGWNDKATARLHGQIKHWRNSGLLVPARRATDGRGTDLFSPRAVLSARLLVALADVGLDIQDMQHVLDGIEFEPFDQADAPNNLRAFVDRLRADPTFKFDARVRILRLANGQRVASGYLAQPDAIELRSETDTRALALSGTVNQAFVQIPLSELLLPLLGAVDA